MKFLQYLVLITLLSGLWLPPGAAHAASMHDVEILGFLQRDTNNDGRVDQAVIECACVTSHDEILVFDGAADMVAAAEWVEGTDTSNDTWVFHIQATDQAKLIIVFESEGTQQSAMLYDDVNGDGMVAYHSSGNQVTIDESPFWSLKITASAGWESIYLPASRIEAWLDKPLEVLADPLKTFSTNDGIPDWDYEITDVNNDGNLDYALSRIVAPIPEQYLTTRTLLQVNSGNKRPQRPATALFWPLLDFKAGANLDARRYFDLLPSVNMDWPKAQIVTFKLPGYPIEDGFFLNSYGLLDNLQVYNATFEAPLAFYDLAADHDNNPELNIRLQQTFIKPWQEIRYSWNQFNAGGLLWDYKVGLMGFIPVDSVVNVGDLQIRMVPYEQLPYWVTENDWQLTTFVAHESGFYESSDGIYSWSPYSGEDPTVSNNPSRDAMNAAEMYLSGLSDTPPYEYFSHIRQGFRGEYHFVDLQQPILYFSPVDQRLHLLGAEYGFLNLGQGGSVVYKNRDGDDYIDEWTLMDGTNQSSRLSIGPSYLLYSDATQVVLKKVSIPFSIFEAYQVFPPRNIFEWQALGQVLVPPEENVAPQDFSAMLSQFDGQEWMFNQATASDYRNLDQGCRFLLTIQPGYSGTGMNGARLSRQDPGRYVVEFNQATFSIRPVIPVPLQVEVLPVSGSSFRTFDQVGVRVALLNPGLEDVQGVVLDIQARNADNTLSVFTQNVNLLAEDSLQVDASWQPTSAGTWDLEAVVTDQAGNLLGRAQTSVEIISQPVSPLDILSITSSAMGLPLLGLLVTAALICGLIFSAAWPAGRGDPKNE